MPDYSIREFLRRDFITGASLYHVTSITPCIGAFCIGASCIGYLGIYDEEFLE
jgi:hypothetical protein